MGPVSASTSASGMGSAGTRGGVGLGGGGGMGGWPVAPARLLVTLDKQPEELGRRPDRRSAVSPATLAPWRMPPQLHPAAWSIRPAKPSPLSRMLRGCLVWCFHFDRGGRFGNADGIRQEHLARNRYSDHARRNRTLGLRNDRRQKHKRGAPIRGTASASFLVRYYSSSTAYCIHQYIYCYCNCIYQHSYC